MFFNIFWRNMSVPEKFSLGKVPARDNTGCIHSIYPIPDIHKSNIHTAVL